MSAERPTLPPVRLHTEAELARDALAAPLLARAVRLARWAGDGTRVGAGGELVDAQLPAAAEHLGLAADEDGAAEASEAWRLAVDAGLIDVEDPDEDAGPDAEGTATAGENLALVTGGSPKDVLSIWLDGLEAVHADATAPVFDDLAELVGEDGSIDFESLDWDPEVEAEFLDGVLGNLYLLTVGDGHGGTDPVPVPLPALAASVIVPDDMGEPTDDVLELVSEAMMRLDDQFRVLEPIGIVEYRPVDEALLVEEGEEATPPADDEDVTRYGMVKLTPSVCTACGPGCWRPGWTPRPSATWRTRAPTHCSVASRTTPRRRPAVRSSCGSPGAAVRTVRRPNSSRRHAERTSRHPCAGCTASRRSPWSARRRSPRCARCWRTPSWAASPGSGSRSWARPVYPHRRNR